MREVSIALLTLADSRIVFQRRGKDAPISPNLLGFFGGHVERGETFAQALRRELSEETSLKVDELEINHLADYIIPVQGGEAVSFHLYQTQIVDLSFTVYEGDGAEAYTRDEARARNDLTPSAHHVLNYIII